MLSSLLLAWPLSLAVPLAPIPQDARPAPREVAAPIRSVALFKNGIAVVRRVAELPGPGDYVVGEVPDAVHGTLWLDADGPIEARATTRAVEVPTDGRFERDSARELAGHSVRLRLRGEPLTELAGRVVDFEDAPQERSWSRTFEQRRSWYGWYQPNGYAPLQPEPNGRFLALDTDAGRTFVDLSTVAFLSVADAPTTRTVERPVLELSARGQGGRVAVSYLTKGLSYAPSYRLDIADPRELVLSQTAVVRNELEDLVGVDLELVSGFPSMEQSHVLSPFSASTTWADFFAQLSQQLDGTRGNRVLLAQNAASNFVNYDAGSGTAIQPSEGVDLHYHAIGKHDLREGESLFLHVATARTSYTRIVEWRIPDTRDEWGRTQEVQSWQPAKPDDQDGAWDALRFANPFDYPMTTAPAMIVSGERFQGQRTTTWVNPGEETTVRITKALAVRTVATEYELDTERDVIVWGGRTFRKVHVRGELQLCNHRGEAVNVVVRREFSGDLDAADAEPHTALLERGVYSVNRRQELVWNLELAAGEERKVTYTYTVLVYH